MYWKFNESLANEFFLHFMKFKKNYTFFVLKTGEKFRCKFQINFYFSNILRIFRVIIIYWHNLNIFKLFFWNIL